MNIFSPEFINEEVITDLLFREEETFLLLHIQNFITAMGIEYWTKYQIMDEPINNVPIIFEDRDWVSR